MSAVYSTEWKKSTRVGLLKRKKKKAAASTRLLADLSFAYMQKSFEDKLMDK